MAQDIAVNPESSPRRQRLALALLLLLGALLVFSTPAAQAGANGHHSLNGLHAGMARSSGMLGVRLLHSDRNRGERLLAQAATHGDTLAQYNLGVAYARGEVSGRRDAESALYWYQHAANAGYGPAAYNAGALYANGDFGRPDMARAELWMRKAAAMHHAGARNWLSRRQSSGY